MEAQERIESLENVEPIYVEAVNISKAFAKNLVLNHVSLTLRSAEIVGLVGRNGAGKTTLLNILAGFLKHDGGEIRFSKAPVGSKRLDLLFLPDIPAFASRLTSIECLKLACDLADAPYSRDTLEKALHGAGISAFAHSRANTLSIGTQKRLQWAHALLLRPLMLLLDEPSAFLDPPGIVALRNFIFEIAKDGCAVMLSSHNMHEVLRSASRVYLLKSHQLSEVFLTPSMLIEDLETRLFGEAEMQVD